MTGSQSDKAHHFWGCTIKDYPKSYSNPAISKHLDAPLDETRRGMDRGIALQTIEEICMLGQPVIGKNSYQIDTGRITLSRLRSVLDLVRFPSEYENFALPRLVGGCIVLISTVRPSPFYYEYGYLSFRLMVIALTACLLRYGCYLDPGREGTKNITPSDTLQNFWEDSATIIGIEMQTTNEKDTRLAGILDSPPRQLWTAPLLDQSKLQTLLNILYEHRKHFLTVMKQTKSLGLSGVMFVLWKYITNKKAEVCEEEYFTRFHRPYSQILSRYQLVASHFYLEPEVIRYLSDRVPLPHTTPQENRSPIDLADSRHVIQAYTDFLVLNRTARHVDAALLLKLVVPLVTSGCEDLLPGMFGAAMRVFWSSLSVPEPHFVAQCLSIFLDWFSDLVESSLPTCVNNQAWKMILVHNIVNSDVAELILRLTLIIQDPAADHSECIESASMDDSLDSAAISFARLLALAHGPYLSEYLHSFESLHDWMRYERYFGTRFLSEPSCTLYQTCVGMIARFSKAALGENWEDELSNFQVFGIPALTWTSYTVIHGVWQEASYMRRSLASNISVLGKPRIIFPHTIETISSSTTNFKLNMCGNRHAVVI